VNVYELDGAQRFFGYSTAGDQLVQHIRVDGTDASSGHIAAKVTIDDPKVSRLVLSECFMPGWKCWIDGRAVPIEPFRDMFLSVPIEPGTHGVQFDYQPASFSIGLGLSVVGILVCAALLLARFVIGRGRFDRPAG
jgi:uncharacterized membrane protein YfhO